MEQRDILFCCAGMELMKQYQKRDVVLKNRLSKKKRKNTNLENLEMSQKKSQHPKVQAVPCKPYYGALKLQLQSNRLLVPRAAFLEAQEQQYQYELVVIQIQVLDFWPCDTAYMF